jgi:hypothetical protein
MSDEKISSKDLERAISRGIFKGGLRLSIFIFIMWIFTPFILPLAVIGRDYTVSRWLEPFVRYISQKAAYEVYGIVKIIFGIAILCVILWVILKAVGEAIYQSQPFTQIRVWTGSLGELRIAGVVIGFGLMLLFIIFLSASRSMSRPFEYKDFVFLSMNFLSAAALLIVSIRGSGKSAENSAK